ncbi:hypothetical protein [Ferrimonas marina]|uniref:Lipoprotein n=1 Tax=Ferrimonas marina TaxID=299255 RepID=A0A1M5YHW7_9GAMM|nr:hypothetical protein [Ferrimonas marina]SHI11631.1 hypothetical protein SAMN02745129_4273 [Ferrimonas marina]
MRRWGLGLLSLGLVGCSVLAPQGKPCAELVTFAGLDPDTGAYNLVLTAIDGRPVVSKPLYRLAPGQYRLELMEFIDDPRLAVPLKQRRSQEMVLTLAPMQRYTLAARLVPEQADDPQRYWQPEVWQLEPQECRFPKRKNT